MISTRMLRVGLVGGVLTLALAVIAILHIGIGAAGGGPAALLDLVTGRATPETRAVLLGSRLARTIAGLAAGIALGIAGSLIQGATRNPLAAPDTLGVNAGAYLAVALLAYLGSDVGLLGSGIAAFSGGLLAVGLVYLLTGRGVLTPGRVLLTGAVVTMAGMAGAEFLQLLDGEATRGLFFWGNGTLVQTALDRPLILGAVIAAVALLAPLLARPLDLLALGDEAATAMGVRVNWARPASWLLAVVLSAVAVTLTGPIGFVGFVAPVAVRLLGIRQHAALVPLAGLAGATLVLAADTAARAFFPPSAGYGELPVGVVTALVGGPVFVMLARRTTTGDAGTGAAVSVAGSTRARRYTFTLTVGLLALLAAVVVGLSVGDVDVSWGQVTAVLAGAGDELTNAVLSLRLPRILVAAAAGACLAVAGVAAQSVVRNPLAEPGLLGITSGASAGAVLIISVLPAAPAIFLPLAAGIGGVVALVLVIAIARDRTGLDPTRVVLVGLGVAATADAAVNAMAVSSQMDISAALTWLSGSTYGRDATALGWFAIPALVAVVFACAARSVNMLALGEDLPRALGLALGRARMLVLGVAAVLAAGTAAAVGAVGFVGLVAPHLARRLVGSDTARLVPVAALLGATLVVAADAVGRTLLAPVEIPVGVVTAILGAPYLVILLRNTSSNSRVGQ